jgi:hypothetical protein
LEFTGTTPQPPRTGANARTSAAESWGAAAGAMQGGDDSANTRLHVAGAGYLDRQTAGFADSSSLIGAGAGGNTTAAGQSTMGQQQRTYAGSCRGVDLPSMSARSTYMAAPSAPAHTGNQNGDSQVYLNPNSAWVQHADSGGKPWYYNSETADVCFSPPREGVLRIEG